MMARRALCAPAKKDVLCRDIRRAATRWRQILLLAFYATRATSDAARDMRKAPVFRAHARRFPPARPPIPPLILTALSACSPITPPSYVL